MRFIGNGLSTEELKRAETSKLNISWRMHQARSYHCNHSSIPQRIFSVLVADSNCLKLRIHLNILSYYMGKIRSHMRSFGLLHAASCPLLSLDDTTSLVVLHENAWVADDILPKPQILGQLRITSVWVSRCCLIKYGYTYGYTRKPTIRVCQGWAGQWSQHAWRGLSLVEVCHHSFGGCWCIEQTPKHSRRTSNGNSTWNMAVKTRILGDASLETDICYVLYAKSSHVCPLVVEAGHFLIGNRSSTNVNPQVV